MDPEEQKYCRLCKVPLSGIQAAEQHYMGRAHKKKLEQQQQIQQQQQQQQEKSVPGLTNFMQSPSCSASPLSSTSQLREALHLDDISDTRPLTDEEKIRDLAKQLALKVPGTAEDAATPVLPLPVSPRRSKAPDSEPEPGMRVTIPPTQLPTNPTPTPIIDLLILQPERQRFDEPVPNFAKAPTTTGLSSSQIPNEEFTFSGTRGHCYICDISLTSIQHRDQHLRGKNHSRARDRWEEAKSERFIMDEGHSGVGNLTELKPYFYDPLDDQGKCFACSRSFKSLEDIREHLRSEEHKENESHWNREQRKEKVFAPTPVPSTEWHECSVCRIRCNTATELEKHKNSPRHQKEEEKQRADMMGGAQYRSASGDRTVWFKCDICYKSLNSEDQLKIHTASHKPTPSAAKISLDASKGLSVPNSSRGALGPITTVNSARGRLGRASLYTAENLDESRTPRSLQRYQADSASYFSSDEDDDLTLLKSTYHSCDDDLTQLKSTYHSCADDLTQLKSTYNSCDDDQTETKASYRDKDLTPLKTNTHEPKPLNTGVASRQWQTWEPAPPPEDNLSEDSDSEGDQRTTTERTTTEVRRSEENNLLESASAPVALETRLDSPFRAPEDDEGQMNENCITHNCFRHCDICDMHLNGLRPYEDHQKSRRHREKLASLESGQGVGEGVSPFPGFPFWCETCRVPFNTLDSKQSHLRGKQHLAKSAKAEKVPERRLPPLIKTVSSDDCEDKVYNLLNDKVPRGYQAELYTKAMGEDTVCFLPTGTGKTVISAMVISHMLRLNSHHPAVFLVDKVLLVLQQAEVLRNELGDEMFERYDFDKNQLVDRKLRIASLCSGRQETEGLPVWKHDLIIVTADFFMNLLNQSVMRWEDSCLVVFDEAHHCDRSHPFHRLLSTYHCALPLEERPKVLGLTASPAGKNTVDETELMLHTLLRNMGGLTLSTVEEPQNVAELNEYRSNTELVVTQVDLGRKEVELQNSVIDGLSQCYQWLMTNTNFEDALQEGKEELLNDLKNRELSDGVLNGLLSSLSNINPRNLRLRGTVSVICDFVKTLSNAFITLNSLGVWFALRDLLSLLENDSFQALNTAGIDSSFLQTQVLGFQQGGEEDYSTDEKLLECMPALQELVNEILQVDWDQRPLPIVLVLIRQRKDALALERILQNLDKLKQRTLSVVSIVGHGIRSKNAESRGMSVNKQDRILTAIKRHVHQVVVATSVAEEGVNLPECELVVQMDPPSCVKALVQIRGRARKKNSRFLAICRRKNQARQIEILQQKETFMMRAAAKVVADCRR